MSKFSGPVALCLLPALLLPVQASSEVICALGTGISAYNAYEDQRPSPDAMQLAGEVNAALTPICRPNCPQIAIFRNATAPNAMLVAANGDAKIVYAPQFLTTLYDTYGEGAVVAIIAHELGHAVDETAPAAWVKREWAPELRADAWAGCTLAKITLSARSLRETLTALEKYPSPAHPAWSQRAAALRVGYTRCGGDPVKFDTGAALHYQK